MNPTDPQADAALDAALREVPIPEGMLQRLHRIAGLTDEELDRALGDVPVPPSLLDRLRRIASRPSHRVWLRRLAVAASLLVALWLMYAGAIVGSMVMFSHPPAPPPEPAEARIADRLPALPRRGEQKEIDREFSSRVPPDDLAAFDPKKQAPDLHSPEPPTAVSPLDETEKLLGRGAGSARLDPLLDANLTRWKDIPSSHTEFDELPELKKAVEWTRRGVEASRSPGYNIAVLTRWGIHPFVSPAIDPRLQTSEAPLGVDAASYGLTRRYLADGELPPRDAIRTEDFLAAIDYAFPRPTDGPIAVHAFGGPSPFRPDGRQVLQIGVQARGFGDLRHPPTRFTVAVDISGSMEWGGRIESVRRGLARLLDALGPEDRVSLVAFSEEAHVVAEDCAASERSHLLAAIGALRSLKSTNIGAGLRSAYAVALQAGATAVSANRVVLISDGLAELDRSTIYRIEQRLIESARDGVRLDVVDLGQEQSPQEESSLPRFAQAGGGRVYRATTADQLHWALLEILTGKSQLAARGVRLRVVFNPKAVAAWRLVGHEAGNFGGLRAAPLEADFSAGQSGTALYEVFLVPNGEPEVARAEVTWRGPDASQVSTTSVTFRREQFASHWSQAPWQVQAATIAAETAEALRGSPEVLPLPPFARVRTGANLLTHVLRTARELDTRVRGRPTFAEFVEVLKQLEAIRPSRNGRR